MLIHSGGRELSLCFMTPTWGADLGHFRWLRHSLERTGFAEVPHRVVVQTEDLPLFKPLATGGVRLMATAEVLPAELEKARRLAAQRSQKLGRRLTKLCASIHKRLGWCDWLRYSGWHLQQITKLQVAADSPEDLTVVLDSDLMFTRPFDLQLFAPDGRAAVFEAFDITPQTPGLGWKWHGTASRLLKQPIYADRPVNGYWATPFVFDRETVRALQQWLEAEYARPWYEVLLAQPLAGWSEFCTYTMFARAHGDAGRLAFRGNPHFRGMHSVEHRLSPEKILGEALSDPQAYFMCIQSDRREQQRWGVELYETILARHFAGLDG